MDFKIHVDNLAFSAIRKLKLEVNSVKDKIQFNPYTLYRLEERNISIDDVRETILNGELIEYHYVDDERRILLRNKEGTCVVLDVSRGRVITVYKNDPDDNHKDLNRSNYLF